MSSASIWVGAVLLAAIVLAHHDLFRAELGVGSRLSTLVDRLRTGARSVMRQDIHAHAHVHVPDGREGGAFQAGTKTTEHVLFLVGLVAGGFAAALATHSFAFRPGLASDAFASLMGGRLGGAIALFFGGLLVGAGMRMAGSALGGHGLLGLSRLDRGTRIATASFLASAVCVSFLLEALQ